MPFPAGEPDASFVLIDDFLADRKPRSGAFRLFLQGVGGDYRRSFEEEIEVLLFDPDPLIRDADLDPSVRGIFLGILGCFPPGSGRAPLPVRT